MDCIIVLLSDQSGRALHDVKRRDLDVKMHQLLFFQNIFCACRFLAIKSV